MFDDLDVVIDLRNEVIDLKAENERLKAELATLRAKMESAPIVTVVRERGDLRTYAADKVGLVSEVNVFNLKPGEARMVRLVEVD